MAASLGNAPGVSAAVAKPESDYPSVGAANYGVVLLFLAYVLSFLDRNILSLLIGPIREQFRDHRLPVQPARRRRVCAGVQLRESAPRSARRSLLAQADRRRQRRLLERCYGGGRPGERRGATLRVANGGSARARRVLRPPPTRSSPTATVRPTSATPCPSTRRGCGSVAASPT